MRGIYGKHFSHTKKTSTYLLFFSSFSSTRLLQTGSTGNLKADIPKWFLRLWALRGRGLSNKTTSFFTFGRASPLSAPSYNHTTLQSYTGPSCSASTETSKDFLCFFVLAFVDFLHYNFFDFLHESNSHKSSTILPPLTPAGIDGGQGEEAVTFI